MPAQHSWPCSGGRPTGSSAVGRQPASPRSLLFYCMPGTHVRYLPLPPHLSAVPSERYEVDPELAKALEIIFILHLDHEQNASTSTVRWC